MIRDMIGASAAIRQIPSHGQDKPLDTGGAGITASIGNDGKLRSFNDKHSVHGYVTLTGIEPFPNSEWYHSDYVRSYRTLLVESDVTGFGCVPEQAEDTRLFLIDHRYPAWESAGGSWEAAAIYLVDESATGSPRLVQWVRCRNTSGEPIDMRWNFGGRFSLHRCSYGQLTEGGPIPLPETKLGLSADQRGLYIQSPSYAAEAAILLFGWDHALEEEPRSISKNTDKPVDYSKPLTVRLMPGETRDLFVTYQIRDLNDTAGANSFHYEAPNADDLTAAIGSNDLKLLPSAEALPGIHIWARNVDYILSCCAVPVRPDYCCILTDHQLLPLSWNRDSFYMMMLLVQAYEQAEHLFRNPEKIRRRILHVLRGHLLWMFERADCPEQYWGRAYLTNGYCKDLIYQLDQQCYPLWELAVYYQLTEDRAVLERCKDRFVQAVQGLFHVKDPDHWLFRTAETPADDKVELPYHLSSHILLWKTLQAVEQLNQTTGWLQEDIGAWAEGAKQAVAEHFSGSWKGSPVWAYLTDGRGRHSYYHDANDLPTVLAPEWGFVEPGTQAWEQWNATMAFAFTEENKGGFYPGPFGGLGSVHTPHPWPLGDAQELAWHRLNGRPEDWARVWSKLQATGQRDGLFSEAVDEQTGRVRSRYWFSWPGAAIAMEWLKHSR